MIEKKDKCINPWFGFLVIMVVCILIASAIFFEFKGSTHHTRLHKMRPQKGAGQAAFPAPATGAQEVRDKLLF